MYAWCGDGKWSRLEWSALAVKHVMKGANPKQAPDIARKSATVSLIGRRNILIKT